MDLELEPGEKANIHMLCQSIKNEVLKFSPNGQAAFIIQLTRDMKDVFDRAKKILHTVPREDN